MINDWHEYVENMKAVANEVLSSNPDFAPVFTKPMFSSTAWCRCGCSPCVITNITAIDGKPLVYDVFVDVNNG